MLKESIIEIEIKISLNDLKNDLKKGKEHYRYINNEKAERKLITKHSIISDGTNNYYTPNKFYFCVPISLQKETLKFISNLNPKYGLIIFDPNAYYRKSLTFIKRATFLHKFNNIKQYERKMIDRISNDLVNKYYKLYIKTNI